MFTSMAGEKHALTEIQPGLIISDNITLVQDEQQKITKLLIVIRY